MSIGAVPEEELIPLGPGAGPAAAGPDAVDKVLAADATGAGDVEDLVAPPAVVPGGAPAPIDEKIVPVEPDAISGGEAAKPDPTIDAMLAKLPPAGAPAPGAKGAAPATAEEVIDKQRELDIQKAEDAKRTAEAQHIAAIDHQADLQDALDHGNAIVGKRQKAYDDALGKYDKMQIRDYWDNPSHSKFAAGIAIALGGLGAALSAAGGGSGENHVLAQINKKVDDDYQHQKLLIEKARDSVVMAKTGLQDAREAKTALLEDVTARKVATLGALESEARRQLAERGVPAAQIDADTRVLQLQAARVKAAREADEQRRKDAMADAQIKYLNARANKLGRGAGGGGAGSSGKMQALTEALQKSGGEITPDVAAVADRLRIKPTDLRGMATSFKQERRVDLQERGEVAKDVKDWADRNQFNEKSKKAVELNKLARVLQGDKVTGLDRAFVLQEAEKAAKGGTATMGGVQIDMEHLAGGRDRLNQVIAKWKDGDFSSAQSQRLLQSIKNQAEAAKQEVDTAHEDFQQTFRENARYAADPNAAKVINERADALFGQHGYSRKPKTEGAPASEGAKAPELVTQGGGLAPGVEAAVRAKYNDPATSTVDRAKAALILTNAGLKP